MTGFGHGRLVRLQDMAGAAGSEGLGAGHPGRCRARPGYGPEQPGGLVIPHQDRLVLHDLDGGGASISAESLLPPPEEPLPRPQAALAVAAPKRLCRRLCGTAAGSVRRRGAVAEPGSSAGATGGRHRHPAGSRSHRPSPVSDADVQGAGHVAAPASGSGGPGKRTAAGADHTAGRRGGARARTPEFVSVGSLMNGPTASNSPPSIPRNRPAASWLRYQGLYQDLLGDLSLLVQQVEVNNRDLFPRPGRTAGSRQCRAASARRSSRAAPTAWSSVRKGDGKPGVTVNRPLAAIFGCEGASSQRS